MMIFAEPKRRVFKMRNKKRKTRIEEENKGKRNKGLKERICSGMVRHLPWFGPQESTVNMLGFRRRIDFVRG